MWGRIGARIFQVKRREISNLTLRISLIVWYSREITGARTVFNQEHFRRIRRIHLNLFRVKSYRRLTSRWNRTLMACRYIIRMRKGMAIRFWTRNISFFHLLTLSIEVLGWLNLLINCHRARMCLVRSQVSICCGGSSTVWSRSWRWRWRLISSSSTGLWLRCMGIRLSCNRRTDIWLRVNLVWRMRLNCWSWGMFNWWKICRMWRVLIVCRDFRGKRWLMARRGRWRIMRRGIIGWVTIWGVRCRRMKRFHLRWRSCRIGAASCRVRWVLWRVGGRRCRGSCRGS